MTRDAQHQQDVGELVKEYQPKLRAFIRKRVSNIDDADDILQDVFYQLTKVLDNSMDSIEQMSAWLYKVARNLIINNGLKKREVELPTFRDNDSGDDIVKSFTDVLQDDGASSPDVEYLRSLVWTELEDALAELPAEQREIFELTEMEGIPVKEISEATGVAVNTLLSRKYYAVKYLRKRLANLYDELIND